MLDENHLFVSYKDADKADETLEGTDMVVFLLNFLQSREKQQEDDSDSSPYAQASTMIYFLFRCGAAVDASLIQIPGLCLIHSPLSTDQRAERGPTLRQLQRPRQTGSSLGRNGNGRIFDGILKSPHRARR